ncbi:hypothetical protein TH8_19730 [Thalassospira profundimaris]|nr:hypothetical protein TH8_19730 [Thalassospira profundimaris]
MGRFVHHAVLVLAVCAAIPLALAVLAIAALWVCAAGVGAFIFNHPWPAAVVVIALAGIYMVGGG